MSDRTEYIRTFSAEEIGADELLDLALILEDQEQLALATRVEIERTNCLSYDSYQPKFSDALLSEISQATLDAVESDDIEPGDQARMTEIAGRFSDAIGRTQ